MLLFLFFATTLSVHSAIIGEWNDANRDGYTPVAGRACAEDEDPTLTAGVNFYVDFYRERVYAFRFNGCEGDGNAYADVPTAEKSLPTDSAQCDGFNMTGWPTYAVEGNTNDHRCPDDSYYLNYGEFSAICCDNSTAERYRVEIKSVCPNGDEPFIHTIVYKNADDEIEKEETRRLIGRNCSHNFCPPTYVCHQGEFEAFCCLAPVPTEKITTEKSLEIETPASLEGGEEGLSGLWIVVLSIVVLTSLVSGFIIWRRRSSRRYLYDQREAAALNP